MNRSRKHVGLRRGIAIASAATAFIGSTIVALPTSGPVGAQIATAQELTADRTLLRGHAAERDDNWYFNVSGQNLAPVTMTGLQYQWIIRSGGVDGDFPKEPQNLTVRKNAGGEGKVLDGVTAVLKVGYVGPNESGTHEVNASIEFHGPDGQPYEISLKQGETLTLVANGGEDWPEAVSYTHLTLPTILLV